MFCWDKRTKIKKHSQRCELAPEKNLDPASDLASQPFQVHRNSANRAVSHAPIPYPGIPLRGIGMDDSKVIHPISAYKYGSFYKFVLGCRKNSGMGGGKSDTPPVFFRDGENPFFFTCDSHPQDS
jgi:hypothetical protein